MARNQQPAAVVAGHICLDITPAIAQTQKNGHFDLLAPGKLVHVGAADVHTGGCVANTGLAMQLLGVPTRLIAKVGQDAFGGLIRDILLGYDADVSLGVDPNASTSYSIVIAPPNIDRMFLHNAGANEKFTEHDVPDALLEGIKVFHFGYPPLMQQLCRNNAAELVRLFQRVKAHGIATSMDMAAIDPASEAAKVRWDEIFPVLLPTVDFFMPSAEELCFMLDKDTYAQWLARADGRDVMQVLDIQTDIKPLAEKIIALGCKVAIIKCGARGMYYCTADAADFSSLGLPLNAGEWAGQSGFQHSYKPKAVVSATGAGDTSIAAFLASALEGLPIRACVQRAAATGACCVETYDALSGLKPLAQLDQMIAAGWEENRF